MHKHIIEEIEKLHLELFRGEKTTVTYLPLILRSRQVEIVWVSGHYTVTDTHAPVRCDREVTGYAAMVKRIDELWQQGMDQDERVAAQLMEEDFHSARAAGVSPKSVLEIRLANGWHYSLQQSRNALKLNGRLTPSRVAARVGVGRTWVYRALYCGLIRAKHVSRHPHSKVWLIEDDAELIAHLKESLPENFVTENGISMDEINHGSRVPLVRSPVGKDSQSSTNGCRAYSNLYASHAATAPTASGYFS